MAKKKLKVKRIRPENVDIIKADENPHSVAVVIEPVSPIDKVYDPYIVKAMVDDIKLGLSLRDTAVRHRLKPETVLGWYNRNYKNFRDLIDTAKVDGKRVHLARIVKADDKQKVKSSQWLLERQHRDEFGRHDPNAVSLNDLALMSNQILQIISHHLESVDPIIVNAIVKDLKQLDIPGLNSQ